MREREIYRDRSRIGPGYTSACLRAGRPEGATSSKVSVPICDRVNVVTDLELLGPCERTGELTLTSIYPGMTVDKVRESIG